MKISEKEIKEVKEAFKNSGHKKYPKISLREAFYIRHHNWISFLNRRELLKKLHKTDWTKIKGQDFSHEVSWQERNGITEPDKDCDCMCKTIKFKSEKELITAIYDFMYENLKSISRGEKNKLTTIGKFGPKEAFLLLDFLNTYIDDKATVYYEPKELIYTNKRGECCTHIFDVAIYMWKYLEYISDLLKFGVNPKIGIFKIGVCPYKKLKDKNPCGKVFIGGKLDTKACDKHANIWKVMMIQHSKLAKIVKDFKKS